MRHEWINVDNCGYSQLWGIKLLPFIENLEDYTVRDLLKRQTDDLRGRISLSIIGQAGARSGILPMFPIPKGSAGWRLYQLFGIDLDEYLAVDRRNLIRRYPGQQSLGGDVFPIHEARERAAEIAQTLSNRHVLFMGQGVASAFGKSGWVTANGRKQRSLLEWSDDADYNYQYAIFPHTGSLNRWWNDFINTKRAKLFLKLAYRDRFYK